MRDAAEDELNREAEDVRAMRSEVDAFSRDDLWYEILGAFRKEAPGTQRNKARQWGLRRRFRKNETPLENEQVDAEGNDVVAEGD